MELKNKNKNNSKIKDKTISTLTDQACPIIIKLIQDAIDDFTDKQFNNGDYLILDQNTYDRLLNELHLESNYRLNNYMHLNILIQYADETIIKVI